MYTYLVLFIQTNTCQIDGDLHADWPSVFNVHKAAQNLIGQEPNLQLRLMVLMRGVFNTNNLISFLMISIPYSLPHEPPFQASSSALPIMRIFILTLAIRFCIPSCPCQESVV